VVACGSELWFANGSGCLWEGVVVCGRELSAVGVVVCGRELLSAVASSCLQ
jgi:hypothetical protein